jgi:hypothetical protein
VKQFTQGVQCHSCLVPFVPGTGRVNEICQHSDPGISKVPGTGLGGWFASIQERFAKGSWHEWHSGDDWLSAADGRPLPMGANQCSPLGDPTKHSS